MHDDARHCARIVRAHARTFALASHFLPPEKRRAAYALYAFCRVADDLVDVDGADDACPAVALGRFRRQLAGALDGQPEGPVFRELHHVVRTYQVPPAVLHELLDGVARDLEPVRYASWAELGRYCEGVASTVGEMCTHVFGVAVPPQARGASGGRTGAERETRDRALRYARTLGVAMQLTNILRDVGEDARRGRCYLPDEELRAAGLDRELVLAAAGEPRPALAADPRWRDFMHFQTVRARALYDLARPGIQLLAPDARRCATACATGYEAILDAIEARAYDSLTARARVPAAARMAILWRVWRGGAAPAGLPPADDGPPASWEHPAADAARPRRPIALAVDRAAP